MADVPSGDPWTRRVLHGSVTQLILPPVFDLSPPGWSVLQEADTQSTQAKQTETWNLEPVSHWTIPMREGGRIGEGMTGRDGDHNRGVTFPEAHIHIPSILHTMNPGDFRIQACWSCFMLFQSDRERQLHTLCPVWALAYYVDRTKSWRQEKQFFVCYGAKSQGQVLSKQHLSKWLTGSIKTAYELAYLPPPEKLISHSTRGQATSWALFQSATVQDICSTAVWASPPPPPPYCVPVPTAPAPQPDRPVQSINSLRPQQRVRCPHLCL
ncbi:UNVERIFIED_CONTAM: hypothetical protein FKN15_017138 [Acipenser sinensis]